jgi:hypothetical protein
MHGAAAVAVHRNAHSKKHEISGASNMIEADNTVLIKNEPKNKERSDKNEDREYIEAEDHLYLFPPPSYRKGDISLSVLMSG